MQITNCGPGIHAREIVGVEKLRTLPPSWYAFTNLEVAISPGSTREIDMVLMAEDRIFVIDLKDWHGRIESDGSGRWVQNGQDRGPSPVSKISQNARKVFELLSGDMKRRSPGVQIPWIQGLVLISGSADFNNIAPTELNLVFRLDDFIKAVADTRTRIAAFGGVSKVDVLDKDWKDRLSKFFNAKNGPIRPGRRRYGSFVAQSDHPTFQHPNKVYAEYEGVDENSPIELGTIRLWDFTKAETRFQNEEGRREIAGRERQAIAHLRDANGDIESAILPIKVDDPDRGVSFWEVFDRRKRLERLSDFVLKYGSDLTFEAKVELARQLLAKATVIHEARAAHLDLGTHSVWLESPSTVRLSHFMVAHFPNMQSLGETRFQFLSSVQLPEMVYDGPGDPMRRDVYLLGVCLHYLILGKHPPRSETDQVSYWDPSLDMDGKATSLHAFFERCLELEQDKRFSDAAEALLAFNEATARAPNGRQVIEGLERFQSAYASQRHFIRAFPDEHLLKEASRLDVWTCEREGEKLLAKLWKSPAWGDVVREGPRILSFLTAARDMMLSPWPNCAAVREVCWLGDAIGLVQAFVEGPTLGRAIEEDLDAIRGASERLLLLKTLIEVVDGLHERGLAHGDLKPENIVLADECRPVLIDVMDFSPSADGEKVTSAYAPPAGGKEERDRFALTKIAEDLLGDWLASAEGMPVAQAIDTCRTCAPVNATLLPLGEAVDASLRPKVSGQPQRLVIQSESAPPGPLLPDEGKIYLRPWMSSGAVRGFVLRGAVEEIEIRFRYDGSPDRARRRPIDQKHVVGRLVRSEHPIDLEVVVEKVKVENLASIDEFMSHPEFSRAFGEKSSDALVETGETDEPADASAYQDSSTDLIAEQAAEEESPSQVDVRELWKKLIEVESELTTQGVAQAESAYRRDIKRLIVPFEVDAGIFEFSKGDTVAVEKLDPKSSRWHRIGTLDMRSRPDAIFVETDNASIVVQEGVRLRFLSHFSTQSLNRRRDAVGAILNNYARIPHLFEVLEGKLASPQQVAHNLDAATVDSYGLNSVQHSAFERILKARPIGLLQGPPGTGKTAFIGALVHYAITHGLANNVLVASQSHEAVNNVAETILDIFKRRGSNPSILRVGNEGVVSDTLLPFHSDKLEQWYKDRFNAEFREKVRLGARVIGVPEALADEIYFIEGAVRPVIERLEEFASSEVAPERIAGLRSTLSAHLAHLGLSESLFDDIEVNAAEWIEDLVQAAVARLDRVNRPSPNNLGKLRSLISIGRDFVHSVSTSQRNFESFLAGTRQIVAGTCVGLGRSSLGLTKTPFDLVIIDEAARCTATELAVPIQAGRWLVFVGDHAQLEPHHPKEILDKVCSETGIPSKEVLRSDFERLFQSAYGRSAGATLRTQYRMLPPIGTIVSETFYEGKLEAGRSHLEIPPEALPPDLKHPITWFTTDGLGEAAYESPGGSGTSLRNTTEVEAIAALLKNCSDCKPFVEWATRQTKFAQVIGVICMYAEQRDRLRQRVQRLGLSEDFRRLIKIDTVDSYQGKQNPIVILSLVRNNAGGKLESGVAGIKEGFLARPNRINVAISRAMDRLVLVGAHQRWVQGSPMSNLASAVSAAMQRDEASLRSVSEISVIERAPRKQRKQPEAAR